LTHLNTTVRWTHEQRAIIAVESLSNAIEWRAWNLTRGYVKHADNSFTPSRRLAIALGRVYTQRLEAGTASLHGIALQQATQEQCTSDVIQYSESLYSIHQNRSDARQK